MICLSLDTTTDIASIALADDARMLAEYSFAHHRDLSCRLLPDISAMLKDCGLTMQDVQSLGVSTGPGSFTGLRIGVVTAKTLAQALDVPVAGIPSLDLLALQFAHLPGSVICPVIKARKGEAYYALFRATGDGIERISDYGADPIDALTARALELEAEKIIFCGDALPDNADAIAAGMEGRAIIAPGWLSYPKASLLASESIRRIQAGSGDDAYTLAPFYIRKSTPEIRLDEACKGRT